MKGLVLGDPSIDPSVQMVHYASLLFELGLIDETEAATFAAGERRVLQAIQNRDYVKAFRIFDELMGGDLYKYGSLYKNMTSLPDYFNFLTPTYPILPFPIFLNLPSTRKAMHVGNLPFWIINATVEEHMMADFMMDMNHFLIPIMDNYKVMIYSGQLDIILGPAGTERYLNRLPWNGLSEYRAARKVHWYLDNDTSKYYVSGYVRQAKQFTYVVIRNAGHMTVLDQPAICLDMLNRFIHNKPFALP